MHDTVGNSQQDADEIGPTCWARPERRTAWAAIGEAQPQGVRYTSYRLDDSGTYVILLELQEGIDENPLPGIAAFRSFQDDLMGWLAEPRVPENS